MPQDTFNELLHGVESTTRWFGANFPYEEIVYVSAASYGLVQGRRRQRSGRRGVFILTRRLVFFKTVWRSLYTLIFLVAGIGSFAVYILTGDVWFLILAVVTIAATFNRLPHQRQILLTDIQGIEAGSEKTFTLRGGKEVPVLNMDTGDHTLRLTLDRPLSDEACRILGIPGEAK